MIVKFLAQLRLCICELFAQKRNLVVGGRFIVFVVVVLVKLDGITIPFEERNDVGQIEMGIDDAQRVHDVFVLLEQVHRRRFEIRIVNLLQNQKHLEAAKKRGVLNFRTKRTHVLHVAVEKRDGVHFRLWFTHQMFRALPANGSYEVDFYQNMFTLRELSKMADELKEFVESEQKAKRVIGFTGLPGSGKDTFARYLALFSGKNRVTTEKFAKPLKEAVASLCNVSLDDLEDREFKETPLPCGKSPRQIMQLMGTEFVRNVLGENFFVQALAESVKDSSARVILITDVRFQNEADWIHSVGGKVFQIVRPDTQASSHVSDAGIQNVDGFIMNAGSLMDLESLAQNFVTEYGLKE